MEIGTRIQELRKKNNISQEQLASIMCVSRQAVSKWESNLSVPDIEKIIELCEYFQVSADYLLMGKEQSKKLEFNWIEFYPILSLLVKLVLMISLYFLGAVLGGIPGTIVYCIVVILIYLLEKKFMDMNAISKKNIFYELGFIFYSFPFIHVLKTVLFQAFMKILLWMQEYVLSLAINSAVNDHTYRNIYRGIKNFRESIYNTSWFPTVYIISLFVIVNFIVIRIVRKKNKE